jgi:hypothetical protein
MIPEELLDHKTDCYCFKCQAYFGHSRCGVMGYDERNPLNTWRGFLAIKYGKD